MEPLDQAIRDAFLEGIRRRGVAAGDVWDYVKWQTGRLPDVETFMGKLLHDLHAPARSRPRRPRRENEPGVGFSGRRAVPAARPAGQRRRAGPPS